MLFEKSQTIGSYIVSFPIKQGSYAETYRVKDTYGKNYFLKIFNYAKLHRTQFSNEGEVLELEIVRQLNHPNLVTYNDSGELMIGGQKFAFIVMDFISGETAAERVGRERGCSVRDAKQIVEGVLEGLKFIHNLPNPVIHNELTIQNVMLDLSGRRPKPVIIDFGYARYLNQSHNSYLRNGLNPFYVAPEAQNGVFTAQSDIFSVGAMLYHLLYGLPPYYVDLSKHKTENRSTEEIVAEEREKPLKIIANEGPKTDESLVNVIARALATDIDERFKSADEFLKALRGELSVTAPTHTQKWNNSSNQGNGT